jgi:hypothetical protein
MDVSLENLDTIMSAQVEKEIRRQELLYDCEILIFFDTKFVGIDLLNPSVSAQVVISGFANAGCPISGLRFGASLYPYSESLWGIKSEIAAVFYILRSLEILINIRKEPRVCDSIQLFESTSDFRRLMHIAHEIIKNHAVTELIDFEIMSYVHQHLYQHYSITDLAEQ